jgi:hypothetical protein
MDDRTNTIAAMDGRFVIHAIKDDRIGTDSGRGWPPRDFRDHG